jgi:hypothetical protein
MALMASIGTPSNSAIHAIDAASMSLTVAPLAMMARPSSSDSSSELPVETMPSFSPSARAKWLASTDGYEPIA